MIPSSTLSSESSKLSPILVVEDEPSSARLILRAFERCGVERPVELFKDGESALERLHGRPDDARTPNPKMPGLLISDNRLPRISGVELIEIVKKDNRSCHIPCILFSASANIQEIVDAYGVGANCYLTKPHRFTELKDLLCTVHRFFCRSEKGGENE